MCPLQIISQEQLPALTSFDRAISRANPLLVNTDANLVSEMFHLGKALINTVPEMLGVQPRTRPCYNGSINSGGR